MSNIIKTTNELLIDCADNGNRQITAQTLRNVVISSWNKLDVPHLNSITIDSSGNVTATSFNGNGASLTSLNATQLTSGSVPSARLTSIPAGNLTGSIADTRLSANVPLKNGLNTFTATNTFSDAVNCNGGLNASSLSCPSISSSGQLQAGSLRSDGGNFTTNGSGVLTVAAMTCQNNFFANTNGGSCSLDNGAITTDGNGTLSVYSLYTASLRATQAASFDSGVITTNGYGTLNLGGGASPGVVTISAGGGDNSPVVTLDTNGITVGGTSRLTVGGMTTLDNGSITTDGSGNLTVSNGIQVANSLTVSIGNLTVAAGNTSLDSGAITTDGIGNLSAYSLTLNGVGGGLYVPSSNIVSLDGGAITTDGTGFLTVQDFSSDQGSFSGTLNVGADLNAGSGTATFMNAQITGTLSAFNVNFSGLPTSDPVAQGQLWNDNGTLKVSVGDGS